MTAELPGGYAEKILRIDLSKKLITTEDMTPEMARTWLGGTGLGTKILWEEVPPEINWDDPENRLIMAAGPLAGTPVWGNVTLSVVTKGAMTNGATSTQANGFFGVNLKLSGYNAIILQGQSDRWVYVYIKDDVIELRDASHLLDKDTWEMQDILYNELGLSGHQLSVYGIGPAGENLVRFAMIEGDYGHVASKNGAGCVMGKKKVKCVAIVRGTKGIRVHDTAGMYAAADEIAHEIKSDPSSSQRYLFGTLTGPMMNYSFGAVPIRNYSTNIYPYPEQHQGFRAKELREPLPHRGHQCGACGMHHCHMNIVNQGPRKGEIVDEPESEGLNCAGPQLGIFNPTDIFWMNTQIDKAGVDINEWAWTCGWLIECMEKGYITEEQVGFKVNWGDVDAIYRLLQMVARRQGFGNILAEGAKRAAEYVGGPAYECAVFTGKGNTPIGHDHRGRWQILFGCTVGSVGSHEGAGPGRPVDTGLPAHFDPFDPHDLATQLGVSLGRSHFEDSLGTCIFTTSTPLSPICQALNAVTGWDYTKEEAMRFGKRISNILRAYNVRAGLTPDMERPSPRYGSRPIDGPAAGKSIMDHWDTIHREYYEVVGWDYESGYPLPETLKKLGLEDIVPPLGEKRAVSHAT